MNVAQQIAFPVKGYTKDGRIFAGEEKTAESLKIRNQIVVTFNKRDVVKWDDMKKKFYKLWNDKEFKNQLKKLCVFDNNNYTLKDAL